MDDLGEEFALSVQAVQPLAQRIWDYLNRALSQVTQALERAPQTPAWSIEVLGEAERHRLLLEWNEPGRSYQQERCIHELFEEQAARSADTTAVVFAGGLAEACEL